MLTQVQQALAIARDAIVVIGVPALFVAGKWFYEQRVSALREQVESLQVQLEESKSLRFDNAIALIEGQKALYQIDISTKERQIASLSGATEKKETELQRLASEAEELRAQVALLDGARVAVAEEANETGSLLPPEHWFVKVLQATGNAVLQWQKYRGSEESPEPPSAE